ncbi:MAG: hypothetical protein BWX69_03263 [Planctomycetes bacterium ADurb.Bin069]|nr:MAG: hypothetical protein BWX69_03263 [Planctomycetes bacterium ADurb.Bin069]
MVKVSAPAPVMRDSRCSAPTHVAPSLATSRLSTRSLSDPSASAERGCQRSPRASKRAIPTALRHSHRAPRSSTMLAAVTAEPGQMLGNRDQRPSKSQRYRPPSVVAA